MHLLYKVVVDIYTFECVYIFKFPLAMQVSVTAVCKYRKILKRIPMVFRYFFNIELSYYSS